MNSIVTRKTMFYVCYCQTAEEKATANEVDWLTVSIIAVFVGTGLLQEASNQLKIYWYFLKF